MEAVWEASIAPAQQKASPATIPMSQAFFLFCLDVSRTIFRYVFFLFLVCLLSQFQLSEIMIHSWYEDIFYFPNNPKFCFGPYSFPSSKISESVPTKFYCDSSIDLLIPRFFKACFFYAPLKEELEFEEREHRVLVYPRFLMENHPELFSWRTTPHPRYSSTGLSEESTQSSIKKFHTRNMLQIHSNIKKPWKQ
jgi:hypothetical protein